MKKLNIFFTSVLTLLILFAGCDILSDRDVLDRAPQDQFSDANVWVDIDLADAFLLNLYDSTPMRFHRGKLVGLTNDAFHQWGSTVYTEGRISPESPNPEGRGREWWSSLYSTIQDINTFLANIDGVVEAAPEAQRADMQARVDVKKGEALLLRSFVYHKLAMVYGGVPIVDDMFTLEDDFLAIERATFAETIDFIVEDADRAAELLLPKDQMEMGRATRGTALALKSRILLFAASDLTTENVSNELVGYTSPDRTGLWTDAQNAAKAVMDLGTYELEDFGSDSASIAQNYFEHFKAKDLSSSEDIWGKLYQRGVGRQHTTNRWQGPNGNGNWGSFNVSSDLVDSYRMNDGSEFSDHFEVDQDGYYQNVSGTFQDPNPYMGREPRFYGTILFDQAKWQERSDALQARDPVGVYDVRTVIVIENGELLSETPGIDTNQGPVQSWNAALGGIIFKKNMDDDVWGVDDPNENRHVEFRYAEILLNYAEASLELGQDAEAATYINRIRNRSGLPEFTGDIREALERERRIELVLEDRHWYDIRRWRQLEVALNTDIKGHRIVETREDGDVTVTWRQAMRHERSAYPVHERMYWVPIPADELNRAPQLSQNPGYN